MADYKELLGKAIGALPENNGAARRQVYEKARNALVAQLRGIDPPLPSREITQHRLQLEDCIRQVEQAATDALLGVSEPIAPEIEPAPAAAPAPEPAPTPEPVPTPEPAPAPAVAAEIEAPQQPAPPVETPPAPEIVEQTKPTASEPQAESAPENVEKPAPNPEPVRPSATNALKTSPVESQAEAAQPTVTEATSAPQTPEVGEPKANAPVVDAQPQNDFEQSNGLADTLMAEASATPRATPAIVSEPKDTTEPEQVDKEDAADAIGQLIEESGSDANDDDAAANQHNGAEAPPVFPTQPLVETNEAAAPVTPAAPKIEAANADVAKPVGPEEAPKPVPAPEAVAPVAAAPKVAAAQSTPAPSVNRAPDGVVAMSEEREVDVDAASITPARSNEAQGVFDRAIQTLDREARGEPRPEAPVGDEDAGLILARAEELRQDREQNERGGGGVMIFLIVLALLLVGAGVAGYWAWKEGYIDVDALFGQSAAPVGQTGAQIEPEATEGPGNTIATPDAVAPVEPTLENPDARLPAASENGAGDNSQTPASANDGAGDSKTEERLSNDNSFGGANTGTDSNAGSDNAAAGATGTGTGAQSLLLEASTEGTTGAVPYSGSVEWSRGTDELGQPTLLAKANIPARSLSVNMLIRRNADVTLPASHLLEIDFNVSDGFIGGGIASLPGILLKNEELVRGTPLFGASARVVGNSFLFALSAAEQDREKNIALLSSRKWMDLALIYATSTRAIVTLEKDAAAQKLFDEVLAVWAEADAAAAPAAAATATDEAPSE